MEIFFFLLTRVEVHSRKKKWEVSGQPWSTENKEKAGKEAKSPGSRCSAPHVHRGPWTSQATGNSRTVHTHGPPRLAGHPPQRWSAWGWVDGEEQPTHFHPSGIINRKTVFNWRGKKSAMNNCKPSNICLLRTFLVHHSTAQKNVFV